MGSYTEVTSVRNAEPIHQPQQNLGMMQQPGELHTVPVNLQQPIELQKKTFDLSRWERDPAYLSVEDLAEALKERQRELIFKNKGLYFQDTESLKKKAIKYRALAAEDGNLIDQYATKYEYRSARKRKNASKDAAKAYEKAAKAEEESVGDANLLPLERFANREKVIRLRMEGMVYAAKVKAWDKRNEAYRIGKAKYSCLTALRNQLDILVGESGEGYAKIRSRLDKEIQAVEASLSKNMPSPDERWAKLNGLDQADVMDKKLEKAHEDNINVTAEDVIVREQILYMYQEVNSKEVVNAFNELNEARRKGGKAALSSAERDRIFGFGLRFVRRDKNGKPISVIDKKKAEWNEQWLEVAKDPERIDERHKLMLQRIHETMQFKLPTPKELEKKGALYYFNQDRFGFFEVIRLALRIDNIKKDAYFKEYFDQHPEEEHYFTALDHVASMLFDLIKAEHKCEVNNYFEEDFKYSTTVEVDETRTSLLENESFYIKLYKTSYEKFQEESKKKAV